jgi:hypothetical protein
MKMCVAFVLLVGCSCGAADVAPAPEPVPAAPECRVVFSPELDIAELTEDAALEWSEATGCDVRTGDGGIPVRFVDRILNLKGEPQCGVTHRERDAAGAIVGAKDIEISTNVGDRCHLTARDVLHEMGHGLAPHRGHTAEGLLAPVPNGVDYVDAVSAEYVSAELFH